jgi:hypothetical protein
VIDEKRPHLAGEGRRSNLRGKALEADVLVEDDVEHERKVLVLNGANPWWDRAEAPGRRTVETSTVAITMAMTRAACRRSSQTAASSKSPVSRNPNFSFGDAN